MGATEIAASVTEGLKNSPLALALVIINVIFIGFNVWFLHDVIESATDTNKRRDALMMQLIKDCTVPPAKKEEAP